MNPLIYLFSLFTLTTLAAAVGTATGFGTSTIMVPVVALFLPFPQALLFVGIIHWFGNIWKMIFFKKGFDIKLVLLFGLPGILVSFLSARLPITLPENILLRLLGIFLILYVTFLFLKPAWKIKTGTANAVLGGTLSGLSAGVFGVGGAVRTAFLSSYDLPKSVFIFTSGIIGFIIDFGRLSQYLLGGTRLTPNDTLALIFSIPASFLGAFLAKDIVKVIPQRSFRNLLALALMLVGLYYLVFT